MIRYLEPIMDSKGEPSSNAGENVDSPVKVFFLKPAIQTINQSTGTCVIEYMIVKSAGSNIGFDIIDFWIQCPKSDAKANFYVGERLLASVEVKKRRGFQRVKFFPKVGCDTFGFPAFRTAYHDVFITVEEGGACPFYITYHDTGGRYNGPQKIAVPLSDGRTLYFKDGNVSTDRDLDMPFPEKTKTYPEILSELGGIVSRGTSRETLSLHFARTNHKDIPRYTKALTELAFVDYSLTSDENGFKISINL